MELYSELLVDGVDETPRCFPFAGGQLAVFSRRSPEKQTPNQDTIGILSLSPACGVLAIADGCGGMAHGDVASRKAMEALQEGLQGTHGEAGPRGAILDAIEQANRDVCALGSGAATTFICLEIDQDYIRPYHVGDSQLLIVSSRGRIKWETCAHSPVGYGVQGGFLSAEEAIHHADRHLVSNVLGSADAHIEIGPRRRLAPLDTVVIASDGLFDNLRVPEISEIVRKGPLADAALRLADETLQRMVNFTPDHPSKPDDLTFLLYRGRPRSG